MFWSLLLICLYGRIRKYVSMLYMYACMHVCMRTCNQISTYPQHFRAVSARSPGMPGFPGMPLHPAALKTLHQRVLPFQYTGSSIYISPMPKGSWGVDAFIIPLSDRTFRYLSHSPTPLQAPVSYRLRSTTSCCYACEKPQSRPPTLHVSQTRTLNPTTNPIVEFWAGSERVAS